ncbi:MAG: HesA/MoeB/ThiF family protein [Actinobacteria bacterium]|nr:HesA/MoeB/ThiF family protein [Actinomycetota bacterium]
MPAAERGRERPPQPGDTAGDDQARYRRHLVIPEIGLEGQRALGRASVLVVGAGGLGSPCLFYLAAAGVGRLGVLDHDVVEVSNLQRQIIHSTADIGRSKTVSAAAKLRALNPGVEVVEHRLRFGPETAADLMAGYDVVVTAVDNLPTRFFLNDACVLCGATLVEAAILRFVGLATTIRGGETACYRCLFPELPAEGSVPSPAEAGVFGPVAGVMGCIQATEAIKVIVGAGRPLYDRLLQFDALEMTFEEVAVQRDPACPVCGEAPRITDLATSAGGLRLAP